VIQSAAVPSGVKSDVESEKAEIHHAETYFRRATAAKPSMAEAHLRLGHVLLLLERPADAIPELRQALASTVDDWLTYYGQLFLGAALESTRDLDGAFGAYTAAATLYPKAQSPHIALSALARRRGDRDAAFKAIQQVFDRPANDPESDDPWWSYFVAQARNADDLLNDLRRPFQPESRP
jgi:tetratricopeptide (TPR) repeat protein